MRGIFEDGWFGGPKFHSKANGFVINSREIGKKLETEGVPIEPDKPKKEAKERSLWDNMVREIEFGGATGK